MGQLLIRGLTDEELKRLREHAKDNDRSLEAQARVALREAARQATAAEREDFVAFARSLQEKYAGKIKGDSVDIIRREREARTRRIMGSNRNAPSKRAARSLQ